MIRSLSNLDCLDLWERGATLHPIDQGLLMLSAAQPAVAYSTLANWPLGRRNIALAELRCRTFGSDLCGWTGCPQCGDKVEFEMDARNLSIGTEHAPDRMSEPIVVNNRSFRVPTSRDMAWAAREKDGISATIRLMESCRIDSTEPAEWSEQDLEAVGQSMALADPMAEILLKLHCPECENEWDLSFDITAFLWTEIEAQAKRLLVEVHTLASAYSWREEDILGLTDQRRTLYLAMVRQ